MAAEVPPRPSPWQRVVAPLRAAGVLALIGTSTVLHTSILFAVSLLKAALPIARWRGACTHVLVAIAESWIGTNSLLVRTCTRTQVRVQGLEGLSRNGWYLVLSNHQSWVDIVVLQYVFNRRIPFLKFFLKQQLIWVPFLGLAWWALDFPFMRRTSRAELARRPELAGRDVAATRRACAKFRELPVSVMNFVEGTRYTPAKQSRQDSEYRHLLRPKAGGVAFVLEAMGELFECLVDVTIVYPAGIPTLVDLVAGRVPEVEVHIQRRPLPADLLGRSYENEPAYRVRVQAWLNGIWREKDEAMGRG